MTSMRIPLSVKFALPLIVGASAFTIIAFAVFVPGIGRGFEAQERDLGGFIPATVASALSGEAGKDPAQVERLLTTVVDRSQLAYALVLDVDGRPLSAAGPMASRARQRLESLPTGSEHVTFHLGEAEVIHFSAPIDSGKGGHVVVGWNRTTTQARFYALVSQLVGIIAVALLSSLIGGIFYGRRVTAPLTALTRAAERITETGDLSQDVKTEAKDEVGQLARAFSAMVTRQRDIVMSLHESVKLLGGAVISLTETAADQSQTITRQAAALQETQVTAQEIKQTSAVAAQKAEAVIRVAERADELGKMGESAIVQSLDGFSVLRAQVQQMASRITELGTRTQQIGSITQTVKDLADQSNMLALNAAIEAVRSGEHGKGFAVVAREIRTLADQSIQATERVREILSDISGAIENVVEITDKGANGVEQSLAQMRASGESVRELSGIVKDNSSAVRQIAGAVSQQNAGIAQIFAAVTDLTRMMDETVNRLGTTNSSIATLKDLSERVTTVVRAYRV